MATNNTLRLCEPATVFDDAWRKLYQAAFPEAEREPECKLNDLISSGKLLYHRTTRESGELLCFSLVSLTSDFALLAFIATDTTQRSSGVGSKHMKRLLELLKEKYPTYLGLFLEIEATGPRKQLTEEEKKTRRRRFDFYKRLGAKRVCRCVRYAIPSRGTPRQELDMDLLYFNFKDAPLDVATKSRVVSDIYQSLYGLGPDDALLKKVLNKFKACGDPACPQEPEKHMCSEDDPADDATVPAPVTSGESTSPVTSSPATEPPLASVPPGASTITEQPAAGAATTTVDPECVGSAPASPAPLAQPSGSGSPIEASSAPPSAPVSPGANTAAPAAPEPEGAPASPPAPVFEPAQTGAATGPVLPTSTPTAQPAPQAPAATSAISGTAPAADSAVAQVSTSAQVSGSTSVPVPAADGSQTSTPAPAPAPTVASSSTNK